MNPSLVLVKKELRQNAVLFLVPAAVLLLVLLARAFGGQVLHGQWLDMAAKAVPIALAVAYGLQAFDLEENGRTRDFLLTKPVTSGQVVAAKYLCGFLVLLPLAFLWVLGLTPEAVEAPTFSDYSSFWLYLYLLLLTVVYSACFYTGVVVKGPKKLLFGTVCGVLAAGWFCWGFFGLLATIWYCLGQAAAVWAWLTVLFGFLSLVFLAVFLIRVSSWSLTNTPLKSAGKSVLVYTAVLCLLPFTAYMATTLTKPAIRPFASLFSTFFGQEEWFAAVEAAKQPGGELYAFADAHGRLGVGCKGQKPKVVYESKNKESTLNSLAWSPDGRRLTFCEDGLIKMYEPASDKGEPISIYYGDIALWSTDPDHLLVLKADASSARRGEVYLVDLAKRTISPPLGTLNDLGLALGWDAATSQLLVLYRDWRLNLITVDTGETHTIALAPPPGPVATPTDGYIFTPGAAGALYRVAVYTSGRDSVKGRRRFNIYFYDVNPRQQIVARVGVLRGVSYEKLVADPSSREMLGHVGQGIYRIVPAPKEVS